ncbi:hypothetical protein L226DRAFT_431125, partial [Lentinus tigrinus ALCF2SS1-7]
MIESEEYQSHIFRWLESIIKSELLGTLEITTEPDGNPLPRPRFRESPSQPHPGVRPLPRITDIPPHEFREQYVNSVNELVEQYNWHQHTQTCWKYLRRNQDRSDANCRMRIDGSTRPVTVLDPDTLSIQLRRLHPRIANYNDLIIFLLQANTDIKHIGSGEAAKALIYYITDYITKSSIPAHLGLAALMYAITTTSSKYARIPQWTPAQDTGALTILVNSMLARTEISHAQVMSYLVGGGDHYTSHRYRLLHYTTFDRTVRRHWDPPSQPPQLQTVLLDQNTTPNSGSNSDQPQSHSAPTDQSNLSQRQQPSLPPDNEPPLRSLEDEDLITLTLSNGSISALNQQQDYLLRPPTEPFNSMPLYEFVGLTEKTTSSYDNSRL